MGFRPYRCCYFFYWDYSALCFDLDGLTEESRGTTDERHVSAGAGDSTIGRVPYHLCDVFGYRQALLRSRMLRENGRYIPKSSFLMRKHFFNDKETGVLKLAQERAAPASNPMQGIPSTNIAIQSVIGRMNNREMNDLIYFGWFS